VEEKKHMQMNTEQTVSGERLPETRDRIPEGEKLTLEHRSLLAPLLRQIQIPLSEYCFANLYFFRNTHDYRLLKEGEDLFLSGISYDRKRYLMPLKDPTESPRYAAALIDLAEKGDFDMIFPVPEAWLDSFKGPGFSSDSLEQDSDYIYTTDKMRLYPGRKLHKKRNLLKQFVNLYEPGVEEMNDSNSHEPLQLLDLWQASSTQEMGDSDYYQCRDALEHRENFDLKGAVFYADGNAVGFMIGEAVSQDVFTIHFAKGDVSIKGVYQYMFNQFAERFCTPYRYINLEQDLGMEGLRKTKRSYLPDMMADKYRVHLK